MDHIFRISFAVTLLMIIAAENVRAENPQTTPGEVRLRVDRAILDLKRVLKPLEQQSLKDGRDGRIFPLDLPSQPEDWRSTAKAPETHFIKSLKILIRAGACSGNSTALKKLFEIERLVYGLGFIEIESLFLQRRAAALKLNLPFHHRYRTKRRYTANMSESPQQELSINVAFDEGRIQDAIKLVPEFFELCH